MNFKRVLGGMVALGLFTPMVLAGDAVELEALAFEVTAQAQVEAGELHRRTVLGDVQRHQPQRAVIRLVIAQAELALHRRDIGEVAAQPAADPLRALALDLGARQFVVKPHLSKLSSSVRWRGSTASSNPSNLK